MNCEFYRLANAYVEACCFSLSEKKFSDILSPNVKLLHQTNREKPVFVKGKEIVIDLFKKFIFDNTSQIDVKSYKIKKIPNEGIRLKLIVEENKKESGKINRYLFEETTILRFEKDRHQQHKIRSISTIVQRM